MGGSGRSQGPINGSGFFWAPKKTRNFPKKPTVNGKSWKIWHLESGPPQTSQRHLCFHSQLKSGHQSVASLRFFGQTMDVEHMAIWSKWFLKNTFPPTIMEVENGSRLWNVTTIEGTPFFTEAWLWEEGYLCLQQIQDAHHWKQRNHLWYIRNSEESQVPTKQKLHELKLYIV